MAVGSYCNHMTKQPISIRPTPLQRTWLQEQSASRGLSLNALVILALEQAMAQPATGA